MPSLKNVVDTHGAESICVNFLQLETKINNHGVSRLEFFPPVFFRIQNFSQWFSTFYKKNIFWTVLTKQEAIGTGLEYTQNTRKNGYFSIVQIHTYWKFAVQFFLNLYSWDKKVQSANTKKLIAAPAICYFIFMLITFLSYLLKLQCHSIFNFYESN